ncbi:MAG: hypothetical protein K8E24_015825 [Methanobacterium paludis]|nr:hypothetical protein [Methanobacterium paludis]
MSKDSEKEKVRLEGLKRYSEEKNQETIKKVNAAIDKLKRCKTKQINFKTVAEVARVSKATLYNNDILKERILSLRAISKCTTVENEIEKPKTQLKKKDEKIKELYKVIEKLKKEQQELIVQLVEMEDIKEENKRLKERLKN